MCCPSMDCTTKFEEQTLALTLRGEKLKQVVGHLLAAGLVLLGFHFLEYGTTAKIAG